MMSAFRGKLFLDILQLDNKIAQRNPKYNPERCEYDNKPDYSLKMVIVKIYGQEASDLVDELIS